MNQPLPHTRTDRRDNSNKEKKKHYIVTTCTLYHSCLFFFFFSSPEPTFRLAATSRRPVLRAPSLASRSSWRPCRGDCWALRLRAQPRERQGTIDSWSSPLVNRALIPPAPVCLYSLADGICPASELDAEESRHGWGVDGIVHSGVSTVPPLRRRLCVRLCVRRRAVVLSQRADDEKADAHLRKRAPEAVDSPEERSIKEARLPLMPTRKNNNNN